MVVQQKLLEKAYFIIKPTGRAMVRPASSHKWKAPRDKYFFYLLAYFLVYKKGSKHMSHEGFCYCHLYGNTGADLGGGCRGCAPPPPKMTCSVLIQLVFCKKNTLWFIVVEVEQETSAPLLKKLLICPFNSAILFKQTLPYSIILHISHNTPCFPPPPPPKLHKHCLQFFLGWM